MLKLAEWLCAVLGWRLRGPVRLYGREVAFLVEIPGEGVDVYTARALLTCAREAAG
jgi:hypothetical protein